VAGVSVTHVRHPLFARFFTRLSRVMEREIGEHRDRLLGGLSGRVLEVGAGNGMNFRHYPPEVEDVVAIEPEPYLRARALEAARGAPVSVRVLDAVAEELPFDDASFDAGVMSLVLCTIPDQPQALAELRRVLRPSGTLRFMEHVRSDEPRKARAQAIADRSGVWPLVGGGCHCSRGTVEAIERAGFAVGEVSSFDLGPSWGITNPHVLGTATAPANDAG
jgi:ubiquinone/menaquinone biosynthesis C-methylase UbiE